MKLSNQQTSMIKKFMGGVLLGLIMIPFNDAAESKFQEKSLAGVGDCSLRVGERHGSGNRHRRMVSVNLLPERCEESDTVTIDIPHEKMKKPFRKVKSKPRKAKKKNKNNKSYKKFTREYGSWYGEDADSESTFNYVQDADGNIHGSLIDVKKHIVMQFSVEDGNPIVTITDSSEFKPEIEPPKRSEVGGDAYDDDDDIGERRNLISDIIEGEPIIGGADQSTRSYLRSNNSPVSIKQEPHEDTPTRNLYDDNGANLDIMVVWTKLAECQNYGLPEGCTLTEETKAAMQARINLAVEETNTAFELSGIQTQLFLAHSYRHSTFVERTSMSDSLDALYYGDISGVKEKREHYGADLVSMILSNSSSHCGTAYIGPRIDLMYSVTAWDCATGNFSFGHEIGHNLGLRHDRGATRACNNKKRYHFAYRDPQARFRTILAYDCQNGQCDDSPGGGCTRIQRFSNPTYDFDGMPVGTEMEDNARKINKVRASVAMYFPHGGTHAAATGEPTSSPTSLPRTQSPTPTPSPSCNDSPLEFYYEQKRMTCPTVGSQLDLCSDIDIQAICPATCGTCPNCVDAGVKFKFFHEVKGYQMIKGCDWVTYNPTARCSFHGISESCRALCNSC